MSRRRVVFTGLGAVTPLGNDAKTTWSRVTEGASGIGKITHFDASGFPSQIAGEVRGLDFSPWVKKNPRLANAMSNTRYALAACDEAVADSGLAWDALDPRRVGIYYAAGDSGAPIPGLSRAFHKSFSNPNGSGAFDIDKFMRERISTADGMAEYEQQPSSTLRHLVEHFRVGGPAQNCLTACAASAQAIGEAAELIRDGEADIMISGGSHSMIHPFGIAGFCLLTTLSTSNETPQEASRPFDATRNGFVLSEGAGSVVLEEYEAARARGARIYGELLGYGSTADAYRLTDSHPEGVGAAKAMTRALEDARLHPADIDYVNAHGTSTKVNDMVETLALKKVFGGHAKSLWVSSTKSMTGHLIAAAGVVEVQFCVLSLKDGIAPPTINYKHKDAECDLDYIPNQARRKKMKTTMSNSFGFGGQNIVLVVGKI